jgi:serine/threonine-protein kinase
MGEVYRAHDTKLNRDVALKILPEAFALDGDRVARFRREAQVLAALNHPNIAAIYGFEDSGSAHVLVLELVEGPTLADRIAKGPIPLDETLPIAKQIAEALEAAHEQGIIHRDLKPSNIKVRDDGTVKVLDFGLAKAMEPASAMSPMLTNSPTITNPAMVTGVGTLLGTAAYMSPEQAKGRPADKRSDVWAYGCVLYEMLAGKRAFESESVSDTLASVLMKEPDWSLLPATTPPHIALLLHRCLQKDMQKRVPHIGVARLEIDDGSASSTQTAAVTTAAPPLWRRAVPVATGVLLTAAVGAAAWWHLKPDAVQPIVSRFVVTLPEGQNFTNAGRHAIAISPDGTAIAYTANQRLYLRAIGDFEARPIQGIDEGNTIINPVFSPDGRSIAFYAGGERTLKRIAVSGGAPVTLGTFTNPIGMSWGPDGILLGQPKGLMRLSPNGGTPEVLVAAKPGEVAHGPQMLPGGKAVLFTLAKTSSDDRWDAADVVVQLLPAGPRKTVIQGGTDARYLSTGHLVYALRGVLFAVPFDPQLVQVSGPPVPIVEGVRQAPFGATGAVQFSVSANGSLVYMPGPVSTVTGARKLAIFDRQGKASTLMVPAATLNHPRISPDGKRVAFVTDDERATTVWTHELSGGTVPKRLTFKGRNRFPIWTDDNEHIVFQSDREGDRGIFWQRADGAGMAERLTTADKGTEHVPESWSRRRDGFLFRVTKDGINTLAFYSMKDRKTTPFGGVQSEWPTDAVFSPNGEWVAYTGGKRGRDNDPGPIDRAIYVQPFPATGATYQLPVVTSSNYRHARWSADGKELFYMIGASGGGVQLMAVGVTTQPAFAFGNSSQVPRPTFWFDGFNDAARPWDVLPDGQHFVAMIGAETLGQPGDKGAAREYRVVLNWFEELKQHSPTKSQ